MINLAAGVVIEHLQIEVVRSGRAELRNNECEDRIHTVVRQSSRIGYGDEVTLRIQVLQNGVAFEDNIVLGRMTLQEVVQQVNRVTRAVT